MKKLLVYALAAIAALNAGCSNDPLDGQISATTGKYTLPAISASLDDAETRTGLGTNQVVNWSNNDRIAVVNLKTNDIKYYMLATGAGTSVGKFEPVNNPLTFDSADDIKAIYPAIAASVSNGKISLTINKEYTKEELAKVGITSWTTNSSAYAFTNNDIKVSYNTSMKTSDDANATVNFKFRQLATWCDFMFDFNSVPEHRLENMESLVVTTIDGLKKISGTAEVDFTDPNYPILKEGTESSIEWNTNGSLSSATLNKSLMLFPCIDGDKLKITVKTNMNTFVFYATPTQGFSPGTILRFPIHVGGNFEKDNSAAANNFTYQVIPNEANIFYYYGESNCLLLANANSGKLDVTPYTTNIFYFNTKEMATSAMKPESAAVIWREAGITRMDKPTITKENDGKYTLNITNVQGNGNALVGIYDNADNLLWSYHIWKPEFDPTAELLEYRYTNSGSYQVMPIALGATAKATVTSTGTATNETNAKALGYYYQWGRKDPLGRANYIDKSGNGTNGANYVTTYVGHEGETLFNWAAAENNPNIKDAALLGSNTATDKDGKDIEDFMIEYVIKNPTHFIQVDGSAYNNSWCGKINNYLWGNPLGYEYPGKASLQRSIFDPCPKGYRVAPKDLWIAFLNEGGSHSSNANNEATYANKFFNILNLSADGKTTTLAEQKGYSFCYGIDENGVKKWQQAPADFYPASGSRIRSSLGGLLNAIGTHGFYWSSSPISASESSAGCLVFFATHINVFCNYGRSDAMAIRCVKEN